MKTSLLRPFAVCAFLFTLLTAPDRKDPWTTKFFTVKQRIDQKVLAFLKAGVGTAAGKGKKRTGKA